jgi:DNA-binding transcriptional regulator YiaG
MAKSKRNSYFMKPTKIMLLRQQLGLTREELAAKAGISYQTVFRWEKVGEWPEKTNKVIRDYKKALGIEA